MFGITEETIIGDQIKQGVITAKGKTVENIARYSQYSSQPVTFVTVCVSPICVMASTVGVVVE